MRRVEIRGVPTKKTQTVLDALSICDPIDQVQVRTQECHHFHFETNPGVEAPDKEVVFVFKTQAANVSRVLKTLKQTGIGESFGEVDVLPVILTMSSYPSPEQQEVSWRKPRRLPTLEIHTNITGSAWMDSDHVLLVAMASGISVIGLLTGSSPYVLAAFFISPLMAMIVATTWGLTIQDKNLITQGLRNMAIGLLICFGVGLLSGLLLSIDADPDALGCSSTDVHGTHCYQKYRNTIYSAISINNNEILSRGPPWANAVLSIPIAAFSGVAIAVGQSSGIASALAGCALSTSLLPPIVNSGLMLGLSVGFPHLDTVNGDSLEKVAWYSAMLYFVNVFWIIVMCWLTFKWKHIGGKTLHKMAPTPISSARSTVGVPEHEYLHMDDMAPLAPLTPLDENEEISGTLSEQRGMHRLLQRASAKYTYDRLESEESCFESLRRSTYHI